jgi:hypothetical protein
MDPDPSLKGYADAIGVGGTCIGAVALCNRGTFKTLLQGIDTTTKKKSRTKAPCTQSVFINMYPVFTLIPYLVLYIFDVLGKSPIMFVPNTNIKNAE